jgi:hypothetical protein
MKADDSDPTPSSRRSGGFPREDRMTRDRCSLPLQVRDQILTLIKRDDLGPGDQLPTEAEIAARFGVARTTAREAFKLLEQDGVVDVRRTNVSCSSSWNKSLIELTKTLRGRRQRRGWSGRSGCSTTFSGAYTGSQGRVLQPKRRLRVSA